MTRLVLLGMVPLFANGESQGVLGREEASVHNMCRPNPVKPQTKTIC